MINKSTVKAVVIALLVTATVLSSISFVSVKIFNYAKYRRMLAAPTMEWDSYRTIKCPDDYSQSTGFIQRAKQHVHPVINL